MLLASHTVPLSYEVTWSEILIRLFDSTKEENILCHFFLGLLLWFTIIHLHQFINSWNTEKAFTCVILRTCQKNLANYKPPSNDTPTTLIFLLNWCGWTFCKVIIKHYRMPYTRTNRTWLLHHLSWFQLPLLSQWNRLLSKM